MTVSPTRRIKIGVMWDDEVVKPHPPVTRALNQVIGRLSQIPNIDIVEWKPYRHDDAWRIIASLYFPDGGEGCTEPLEASGEPLLSLSKFMTQENEYVRRRSVEELWALQHERDLYWVEYAAQWNKTATGTDGSGNPERVMDMILCPATPGVAPPLETARWWGYTSQCTLVSSFVGSDMSDLVIGNLLDYPATVFPVSTVDPTVDVADTSYKPRNAKDEYNWSNCKHCLPMRIPALMSSR